MKKKSILYMLTITICLSLSTCGGCANTNQSASVVESEIKTEVTQETTTTTLSEEEIKSSTEQTSTEENSVESSETEQDVEEGAWITEDLINELLCHPFFEGCTSEQVKEALLNPADHNIRVNKSTIEAEGIEKYWQGAIKVFGSLEEMLNEQVEGGRYCLKEVAAQKKAEAEAAKNQSEQNQSQNNQSQSNQNNQSTEKVDIGINDTGYVPDPGDIEYDDTPLEDMNDIVTGPIYHHDWK